MNDPTERPSLKSLGTIRRKAVSVSEDDLVRTSDLEVGRGLPLLVEPAVEGVDLAKWMGHNRELAQRHLLARGGLLFRGFGVAGEERFQAFVEAAADQLLEYTYRSTPRTKVRGKIYTSTEYPADQSIPMHNEMSYSRKWPLKIAFFCVQPAADGGETPIADSRRMYQRIDAGVRERFAHKQVMYIRNYGEGLDLSWQDVFQTDDRAQVTEFCREAGIELEWRSGDRLTTRQVCQAVADHPVTREKVWFNQAHLFHVSSLAPGVREALLSALGDSGVPRNTFYGDGSPIEPEALDHIRAVYDEESVLFPWQQGDILLLDNMLAAHGRRPFSGSRQIVVGMAEPYEIAERAA